MIWCETILGRRLRRRLAAPRQHLSSASETFPAYGWIRSFQVDNSRGFEFFDFRFGCREVGFELANLGFIIHLLARTGQALLDVVELLIEQFDTFLGFFVHERAWGWGRGARSGESDVRLVWRWVRGGNELRRAAGIGLANMGVRS